MIQSPFIARFWRLEQQKRNAYSFATFSLVTTIFFAIFAIRPSVVTIANLVKKYEMYKRIDQEMTTKLDGLANAKKNFDKSKKEVDFLREKVPDEKAEHEFIREVSFLVAQSKVSLSNTTFLKPQDASNEVGFSIKADGRFNNILEFVSSLQKSRRAINIKLIEIESRSYDKEASLS